MIILIDTKDKVIEVEGIENEKETKRILRETLKNFKEYEHIVIPSVKIKVIPIDKTFTIEDFVNKLTKNFFEKTNITDVKPGPPK